MLYAAYGSNLHPIRLRERIASARLLTTAFLPGWGLKFHKRSRDGSGKCNIVPHGYGVYVAVFDISPADKVVLDRIEGVGKGYLHHDVDVPSVGRCATYVAQPSYVDEALLPFDWYRELVLLGARAHAFPQHYVDGIGAIRCGIDPDPRRLDLNRRTITAIRAGQATDREASQ